MVWRVERIADGYIAPNGLALTPTEEWLEANGFHKAKLGDCWFLNWPVMSYVRDSMNCIRIYPGQEGLEVVGCNGGIALLGGCWPSDRVSELWYVITGQKFESAAFVAEACNARQVSPVTIAGPLPTGTPDRLLWLAKWFDAYDARFGYESKGVQRCLRQAASELTTLRQTADNLTWMLTREYRQQNPTLNDLPVPNWVTMAAVQHDVANREG